MEGTERKRVVFPAYPCKVREPWYRASKNKWYVMLGSKKVPLGPHPAGSPPPKMGKGGWNAPPEIMTAFHRLMAQDPACLPKAEDVKVCQVLDLFLGWSEKHHKLDTFRFAVS